MKNKIKALFQSIKSSGFNKRIFNKKTIIGVIVAVVIIAALRLTFSLAFEVKGTVSQVDGSNITVVNFLTTKTVDIGNFQTASTNIQVGDRIEIEKNLSGDIINVRDNNNRNFRRNGNQHNNRVDNNEGAGNFKDNSQRNSMKRR